MVQHTGKRVRHQDLPFVSVTQGTGSLGRLRNLPRSHFAKVRHLNRGLNSLGNLRKVPACQNSHSSYLYQEELKVLSLTYIWYLLSKLDSSVPAIKPHSCSGLSCSHLILYKRCNLFSIKCCCWSSWFALRLCLPFPPPISRVLFETWNTHPSTTPTSHPYPPPTPVDAGLSQQLSPWTLGVILLPTPITTAYNYYLRYSLLPALQHMLIPFTRIDLFNCLTWNVFLFLSYFTILDYANAFHRNLYCILSFFSPLNYLPMSYPSLFPLVSSVAQGNSTSTFMSSVYIWCYISLWNLRATVGRQHAIFSFYYKLNSLNLIPPIVITLGEKIWLYSSSWMKNSTVYAHLIFYLYSCFDGHLVVYPVVGDSAVAST